jgi:hypothetical protein
VAHERYCRGYRSATYQQGPHLVPDDREHFYAGKTQCRDCYRAYARDWRAGRPVQRTVVSAPRVVRPEVMDGASALRNLLTRAGYQSVEQAVAEHTIFLDPSVVAQTRGQPIFPSIRNMLRRRQFETLVDGTRVLLDDNTTPTDAFLWAAGLIKGPDVQFNHVWTAAQDVRAYTALWNVCATPAFLAKTTDGRNHPGVVAALQYRAFDLYGFHPVGTAVPTRPEAYESLVWAPHPPQISDLQAALRARLHARPKSPGAIAAREIGWLFSEWNPDPTI